jgi:hypothetical protein
MELRWSTGSVLRDRPSSCRMIAPIMNAPAGEDAGGGRVSGENGTAMTSSNHQPGIGAPDGQMKSTRPPSLLELRLSRKEVKLAPVNLGISNALSLRALSASDQ